MDKTQAKKLIQETFEAPFGKEKFLQFTKNLLNKVEDAPFRYQGHLIPESFKEYITQYERLGRYSDGENRIDILAVYLRKETSVERARTMQRNFVAGYLQGKYGSTNQKDAAIVAFVAPDFSDWRFSLVKLEYRFEKTEKGRVKVKEEFTPAKRWSFLVGPNEKSHTAQSRLVPMLEDDTHNPTLTDLEEAFNIEKVTKEFFEKYRELFIWTKETLDETVRKDKKIRDDFESKGVDTVDFAKKLLGQIVFLYFLQKKGWFGVNRDADWGTGPKNFLRELFEGKHGAYKNFFNDILEPLFYEALARERDDDFYSRFNCKIPFLNGGLFDPINNYDWVHTDILLPNELFSNHFKTKEGDKGNGILDIFDRYNFTVKEDEPLEKEVAVDPEMLGKVFENLLEIKDRKSKGTYYTPREIVHYMCQQSLINYLATEPEGKVSKEDCEKLIKYGESVSENEALVEKKGQETQTYYYKLPQSIRDNAQLIDEKLANIKVCDPAVGSGAFLVGMMTEIVRTRHALSSYIKGSARTPYNFKWECILNSLYGVDIDPGAVEIAKLRLWLSLVVDEEDIKKIKPLPNLDYKIMQGNSLLEEYEGVRLFDDKLISTVNFDKEKQVSALKEKQSELQSEYIRLHQTDNLTRDKKQQIDEELKKISAQIKRLEQAGKVPEENASLFDIYNMAKKKSNELKRLQKEFFETTQKTKKDEIKKQIERLEWELIEATLREQDKTSELEKLEALKKANIKPFFLWKLHFADVFQDKGGFDVVIGNPPYGAEFKKSEIINLVRKYNYYDKQKNSASFFLELAVNLCRKTNGSVTYIVPKSMTFSDGWKSTRQLVSAKNQLVALVDVSKAFEEVLLEQVIVSYQTKIADRDYSFLVGEGWKGTINLFSFLNSSLIKQLDILPVYVDPKKQSIYSKMIQNSVPLSKISDTFRGLPVQRFISKNGQPILRGKNIGKYSIYGKIDKVSLGTNSDNKIDKILQPKIVSQNIVAHVVKPFDRIIIMATIDSTPYLTFDTVMNTIINDKRFDMRYILAIINSTFASWFYYWFVYNRAIRTMHFDKYYLGKLPIKVLEKNKQIKLAEVVDEILTITKDDDYLQNPQKQAKVKALERQIDQMVYELYGLTKEEIKIVEGCSKEN